MRKNNEQDSIIPIRPFLKWAGGKFQIINKIRASLPKGSRLIEPFVGSGAVFLNTNYDKFILADINADLINLFEHLRIEKHNFIHFCKQFFGDEFNKKSTFLSLRSEFNSTTDNHLKAALFLYLNRHSFNGLMRYNSSGKFNTAFGDYKKPYFPENEMLAFIQKSGKAEFKCADYSLIMGEATKGDVVYCDPPYVPLSASANFTKYHSTAFGQQDQKRLVDLARELASKGIPVILSNHDTAFTQNLYQGSNIISFDVQRNISCNGNTRGRTREVLALFD
ncbi:TPA: Dam family site-specific DNA-(adenine-N6)-methyltransferase [Legionella pneumophila]|nr:Dam family site-specific DNA-(adenine-N6)-methyltransferase [Legionella pneumophila]HAU0282340.1 Dam family site-specific DNA-(adenine-N6)-methyltransferase [Legionella pneumophila]HBD9320262.1 Dam family site-specific DNA-(adenine-N6)-methyltransferase [Legionella pneumophila]HBD9332837.1 Dam family site-specific DNA-(adenine-N6)-methyltransferase [Legionella pneumophila]